MYINNNKNNNLNTGLVEIQLNLVDNFLKIQKYIIFYLKERIFQSSTLFHEIKKFEIKENIIIT